MTPERLYEIKKEIYAILTRYSEEGTEASMQMELWKFTSSEMQNKFKALSALFEENLVGKEQNV